MNVLVTAGNTLVLIDRVRCITNIFTGRTGTRIALAAWERGHRVNLLTSHPDVVGELRPGPVPTENWAVQSYRTFDDLQNLMAEHLKKGGFDAVVHSAAVSDYLAAGVFASSPSTRFDQGRWLSDTGAPELVDVSAGKVKSDAPELWLRLIRAPKLVDRVRTDWDFSGVLVKFKLEVGIGEEELLDIAERSRLHSRADFLVANTLEGAAFWAYLGPLAGRYQRISRSELAARLLEAVEQRHKERLNG